MKMILFILPVSLFPKTSESVSFNPVQIQHLCSYTADMSHAGSAFGRSPSWLLSPTHWPPFRGLGASMLIVDDWRTRWWNCPCLGSWIKAALLQGRQISGQIQHLFNASRSIGSLNQYGYPEKLFAWIYCWKTVWQQIGIHEHPKVPARETWSVSRHLKASVCFYWCIFQISWTSKYRIS